MYEDIFKMVGQTISKRTFQRAEMIFQSPVTDIKHYVPPYQSFMDQVLPTLKLYPPFPLLITLAT